MKRYIRLLGVLLILFSSCSDFLEEKSQDLIIPKSVKDYREFLFGEAYIRDETQIHTYLDIMTDDVKENIKGSFLGEIPGPAVMATIPGRPIRSRRFPERSVKIRLGRHIIILS